ncbi:MAG: DUF5011 domain-containing protein, partial [Nitrosopumilus sp.]|nr:DUF5011 domain-containing protein [Nitrosopumilus sp.]
GFNASMAGEYRITYSCKDASGNKAEKTRVVSVRAAADLPPNPAGRAGVPQPQHRHLDENRGTTLTEIYIPQGRQYVVPPIHCNDNPDGRIDVSFVSRTFFRAPGGPLSSKGFGNNIDTSQVGTWQLYIGCTDSHGVSTSAAEIGRDALNIVVLGPPVISLAGGNLVLVDALEGYVEGEHTCAGRGTSVSSEETERTDRRIVNTVTCTDVFEREVTKLQTVMVRDAGVPTVMLTGDEEVHVDLNGEYEELGAVCDDAEDGKKPADVGGDEVVETVADVYNVTYTCVDSSLNEAKPASRNVTVSDVTDPVIRMNGFEIHYVAPGTYADSGATCRDDVDGVIEVDETSYVEPGTTGRYNVTYTCTDTAGNEAERARIVHVTDSIPADAGDPRVDLVGPDYVRAAWNSAYVDAGATCTDGQSGVIDGLDVSYMYKNNPASSINTRQLGEHTVTYTCTDQAGRTGSESRIVDVVTGPTVDLMGVTEERVERGETYVHKPVSCRSAFDIQPDRVGDVNTDIPGVYPLSYTCTDPLGQTRPPVVRTVTVVDTVVPVITVRPPTVDTIAAGTEYRDRWATCSDNEDGRILEITSRVRTFRDNMVVSFPESGGFVDVNREGIYTIFYDCVDSDGNRASENLFRDRSRTVNVLEPPMITLNGSTVLAAANSTLMDPGATCSNVLGSLNVSSTNDVDITREGTYTITYSCTDQVGQETTKPRAVRVLDGTAPVLVLDPPLHEAVPVGGSYVEPAVFCSDKGRELAVNKTVTVPRSGSIATVPEVDTSRTGVYTITYDCADPSGNRAGDMGATTSRTVQVLAAPSIRLAGAAAISLAQYEPYIERNATCSDANGPLRVGIEGAVDISTVDRYDLRYSCTGLAGTTS